MGLFDNDRYKTSGLLARGLEEATGFVSPKRQLRRMVAETDYSDSDSVENTFNQLMRVSPRDAAMWLKQAEPMIERAKPATGSEGLSNLGQHYRDAMNIVGCDPTDKACKQKAMDLMFKFKKPESALAKGIGEGAADKIWDGLAGAEKAKGSIIAIDNAIDSLDKGVIAGSFSGLRQDVANFLYTAGLTKDPSIVETQKFIADTGNLVLNILGSGDLGAGTGLSDKDVEFAKTVAGASTDLTPEALMRILDMNRRASVRTIERHNKFVGGFDPESLRQGGIQDVEITVNIPKNKQAKPGEDNSGEISYGDFIVK